VPGAYNPPPMADQQTRARVESLRADIERHRYRY
jgi:hypothetical protein